MKMIPHRAAGVEETALLPDYQRILAAVRRAAGPVMGRQVGEMVGVDVSVRAKLDPLRGKLIRMVDRGWLRKLPDGSFHHCVVARYAPAGDPGTDPGGHPFGDPNLRGAAGVRKCLPGNALAAATGSPEGQNRTRLITTPNRP